MADNEKIVKKLLDNLVVELECPLCGNADDLKHTACGEYNDYCFCPEDIKTQMTEYECLFCQIRFDGTNEGSEIVYLEDLYGYNDAMFSDDNTTYWETPLPVKIPEIYKKPAIVSGGRHNHKHDVVVLADGVSIHCSAIYGTYEKEEIPDFGLYADPGWRPWWRNEFIAWPDMSLPTDYEVALQQIYDAYSRAADQNQFVEIGCIGGHGRTGVILACMYLLATEGEKTPKEATQFVRDKYCDKAVETWEQEWFVKYAAHMWYGYELPSKPEKYDDLTHSVCMKPEHIAMAMRGHQVCYKRDKCHFWSMDLQEYKEGKVLQEDVNKAKLIMSEYPLVSFDGVTLKNDDCMPVMHYAMIMNGHASCIMKSNCDYWEYDYKEWLDTGTINDIKSWEDPWVHQLIENCPTAEAWSKDDTNEPF